MSIIKDPVFLMGWPDFGFSIQTPINADMIEGAQHYAADPQQFCLNAYLQWRRPFDAMQAQDFPVLNIRPQLGGGDTVFVRDKYGYVDETGIVLGRFASVTREAEPEEISSIIKGEYIRRLENPESYFEGGDLLPTPFADIVPIAFGPRTTAAAIEEINGMFPKIEIVPLELRDAHFDGTQDSLVHAKFIHGDTAVCVLPNGDLIIYPEALTESAASRLEQIALERGGDVYHLTRDQAIKLSSNIKPWTVSKLFLPAAFEEAGVTATERSRGSRITHTGEQDLVPWLRARGYEPLSHPCSIFGKAGGAWNCLINEAGREMLTPKAEAMLATQRAEWLADPHTVVLRL